MTTNQHAKTDQALIDKYIEQDPLRPGVTHARLRDSGVSVWVLVPYYQAASEDVERVAADYDLPREAVEAVLAYYRAHKCAIDARIADHYAAFT